MRKRSPRRSLSIRVDPEVVVRLERIVEELTRRFPTFRLSTSDAARLALEEGLIVLEEANVKPRGHGFLPAPYERKAEAAPPARKKGRRKSSRDETA